MVPNGDITFNHETRKMIYSHILTYPGVSFIVLKNIFNIKDSTLRYHLKYLERAERILSDTENGKRCYYPLKNEIEISKLFEKQPRSFKFSPIQKRIITIIIRNPGITQKELKNKTKLSRFTISYNIRKFIDMGVVKKTNSQKFVRYEYLTDEQLKHEVLLRLAMKLLNNELDEQAFLKLKNKLGKKKSEDF